MGVSPMLSGRKKSGWGLIFLLRIMGEMRRKLVVFGKLWEIVGKQDDIDTGQTDAFLGFTGNHPLRMDSALRIAIPAKFREALDRLTAEGSSQVFLLPAMGKVQVLPQPAFESVKQQLEQLSVFDPSSEDLRTYIFGNMAVCALDAQNRIRLTPGLCEIAGLEKEVVVVGQQDRMEIWDAVKWKEFNAATSKNLREVMAQVFRSRQAGPGPQ